MKLQSDTIFLRQNIRFDSKQASIRRLQVAASQQLWSMTEFKVGVRLKFCFVKFQSDTKLELSI